MIRVDHLLGKNLPDQEIHYPVDFFVRPFPSSVLGVSVPSGVGISRLITGPPIPIVTGRAGIDAAVIPSMFRHRTFGDVLRCRGLGRQILKPDEIIQSARHQRLVITFFYSDLDKRENCLTNSARWSPFAPSDYAANSKQLEMPRN